MATPPDFTAGQVLTAAQMNAVGLWLVKSQDFTGSDPLDVTSVFTSDFRNYKIFLNNYGSVKTGLNFWFFSGTNTLFNSASYYRYGFLYSSGGTLTNLASLGTTNLVIGDHVTASDQPAPYEITIMNPQTAVRPHLFINSWNPDNGNLYSFQSMVASTTAFTGFRLDAISGTITGNLRIYGYND